MEKDDKACITGRGTAQPVHRHGRVIRTTAKMIVVGYDYRGRPIERRYWKASLREVGASEYGGTYVSASCARKES
jgi:hypothetical protein